MGKYEINYCCGHGTVEKALFGKHDERQRRIEWLEKNLLCPDCYKEKMHKADVDTPKRVRVYNSVDQQFQYQVVVYGQLEQNKALLYKLGFSWGTLDDDFSTTPKKVLTRYAGYKDDEVFHLLEALSDFGYIIDAKSEVFANFIIKQPPAEKSLLSYEDWLKDNPMPTSFTIDKLGMKHGKGWQSRWNGKVYGRSGFYSYYLRTDGGEGEKHTLNDQDREDIVTWQSTVIEWERKKVRAGF